MTHEASAPRWPLHSNSDTPSLFSTLKSYRLSGYTASEIQCRFSNGARP